GRVNDRYDIGTKGLLRSFVCRGSFTLLASVRLSACTCDKSQPNGAMQPRRCKSPSCGLLLEGKNHADNGLQHTILLTKNLREVHSPSPCGLIVNPPTRLRRVNKTFGFVQVLVLGFHAFSRNLSAI